MATLRTDLDLSSFQKVLELIRALANQFDTLPGCKAHWTNVEIELEGTLRPVAVIAFSGVMFDEQGNWILWEAGTGERKQTPDAAPEDDTHGVSLGAV